MRGCTVAVPVYNAFEETLTCLSSVLRSTRPPFRLVVVDDASTRGVLADWLPDEIRLHPRVSIARNARNVGFTRTCNGVIRSAPMDDVVLLNSDTEVPDGWLSRLRDAAYSRRRVATATPLSNNGEIVSVPNRLVANPVPAGYSLEEFAALVEGVSVREYVELPTGVGFCLYIRRDAIDRLGVFDEDTFDRGYGEENDFSRRGRAAGFVDLADDATYVFHKGGASFGSEVAALRALHGEALEHRYPGYDAMIQRFIARDPLRQVRRRIWDAMVRHWTGRSDYSILHVLHLPPWTPVEPRSRGGVQHHVRDLMRTVPGAAHWALWPEGGEYRLLAQMPDAEVTLRLSGKALSGGGVLDRRSFDIIHLHNKYSYDYPRLAAEMKKHGRCFVSLHDFGMCCPRTHLLTADGRTCSAESGECAKACGEDQARVDELRRRTREVLRGARAVFHFSDDTRRHYSSVVGDGYAWALLPHGVSLPRRQEGTPPANLLQPSPKRPLRVLFLGGINREKGANIIRSLMTAKTLPGGARVEWHFAGEMEGGVPATAVDHGPYGRENLPTIIEGIAPHLAAFLSPCVETYCYTLDEALACGLPAVVSPVGAMAERVRAQHCGWVLPSLDAKDILEALGSIVSDWDGYLEVRRRAASVRLQDVAETARQYSSFYLNACRGARHTDAALLLRRIASFERQLTPPAWTKIAGKAIHGAVAGMMRMGAWPLVSRAITQFVPQRLRGAGWGLFVIGRDRAGAVRTPAEHEVDT